TALRAPQVLEDQLAAVARAVAGQDPGSAADVWVMAPMVSTAVAADGFVARCAAHGITTAGVMVEVPSAALCSAQVLANVAFASIGTNDLTQYALAADRLVGDLATLNDPWQPGLLHLVAATCRGAAGLGPDGAGIPVGVCGEAAADPALACVLVGLGVRSLSMSAAALPDVAAALAGAPSDRCREAADAERGVGLLPHVEERQRLVRAGVERAQDDAAARERGEDVGVERRLLVDRRRVGPVEEGELGAEQADPLGPRGGRRAGARTVRDVGEQRDPHPDGGAAGPLEGAPAPGGEPAGARLRRVVRGHEQGARGSVDEHERAVHELPGRGEPLGVGHRDHRGQAERAGDDRRVRGRAAGHRDEREHRLR
ncbi:MAG: hypothetical protein HY830_03370, partial [Actinobacteria bacterium]|nr:hypothetical protein [Actinomycetota bacterium]